MPLLAQGEVLVRLVACGVCHTDLHYREGGINDDFPFLLGHEAAGIVESVGEGVTVRHGVADLRCGGAAGKAELLRAGIASSGNEH